MAQWDFSTLWLNKLKKAHLADWQVQALRDVLPRLTKVLQPQAAAEPIQGALLDLAVPLAKLARELSDCLGGNGLVNCAVGDVLRSAYSQSTCASGGRFDLDGFRGQVEVFCAIVQQAITLAPRVKKGRRSSLYSDMEAVRLIRDALRMAWVRREMQGLPMPARDAGEPHTSKSSGFQVAIDACLATVGCKRSLASARKEVVVNHHIDEAIRADPSQFLWLALGPRDAPPVEEN